jgi:hypothetical protein
MRKLIAIGMVLLMFAIMVPSASATICTGSSCPAPTPIKVPTASFPSGTFGTHSSGTFTGSLSGSSMAEAQGTCAAESLSATKITQIGNGGLVESGGLASASGSTLFNPSSAYSGSATEGSASFDGSGSAIGIAQ